jgi:drug/metabolite transporter (DMT)-like permease
LKVIELHLPSALSLFFVSLFAWLMVLPIVLVKGGAILATHRFPLIALRTLFGLLSFLCILYALKTVDLSEVILLNNTAPLFVPLILWIWMRQKIPLQIWLGLITGLLGIFLVFEPSFGAVEIGLLAALLSGLLSGSLFVVTRQIAHEPFLRILFYYFLIFAVCLSPALFMHWAQPPGWVWGFILGAAAVLVGAQLTLAAGLRFAPSQDVAAFIYTSVIFSGILDWIFWHKVPTPLAILGMGIVCLGGFVTLIRRRI